MAIALGFSAQRNYSTIEGQVKEFRRKTGRVVMCSVEQAETCYELPVGALLGLSSHSTPKIGDKVRLTLSGDRAVAALVKR